MKFSHTILFCLLSICVWSCHGHEHEESHDEDANHEHSHGGFSHTHDHEHGETHDSNQKGKEVIEATTDLEKGKYASELILNGDDKWKVTPEINKRISAIITAVEEFPVGPSQEDYKRLGKLIEGRFLIAFAKNKLEGEARIQMQNFLMPFNDFAKDLQSCRAAKCPTKLVEMKAWLNKYDQFFE